MLKGLAAARISPDDAMPAIAIADFITDKTGLN